MTINWPVSGNLLGSYLWWRTSQYTARDTEARCPGIVDLLGSTRTLQGMGGEF